MSFGQNILGVLALVAILASATIATLSLSPVGYNKSQVAGVSTSAGAVQVLSNLQPLKVVDNNSFADSGLLTQLLKHSSTSFEYVVQVPGLNKDQNALGTITLTNINNQDTQVKITAQSSKNLERQLYFIVDLGTESVQVLSSGLQVIIPAKGTRTIDFYCNSETVANFAADFAFQIEQQ